VGEFWSRQHHCRALASDALSVGWIHRQPPRTRRGRRCSHDQALQPQAGV